MNKPKHFLIFKIIGFASMLIALAGLVLLIYPLEKTKPKEVTTVKPCSIRALSLILCLFVLLSLIGCNNTQTPPENEGNITDPAPDNDQNTEPEPEVDMTYYFQDAITQEVLCNYLSRAVTISLENSFVPNSRNR